MYRLFGKKERPYADLQVHSYYSDGHVPPERLLVQADKLGLHALAITDHDNLDGARAALKAASRFDVEIIPALELTTWWDTQQGSGEIDILGYFIDVDDADLNETTNRSMEDVMERINETCRRLTDAGHPTTMDDVLAFNPRYPAKAVGIWTLVEKHDLSWEAARDLFYQHFNRVRPCTLTTVGAIRAIRAAGGVAVLAHPGRIGLFDRLVDCEQLGWLVEAGLQGIEVFYPSHNHFTATHFQSLAEAFNLVQTGGSDEHAYNGKFRVMGSQPVTQAMVEGLRAAARTQAQAWSA